MPSFRFNYFILTMEATFYLSMPTNEGPFFALWLVSWTYSCIWTEHCPGTDISNTDKINSYDFVISNTNLKNQFIRSDSHRVFLTLPFISPSLTVDMSIVAVLCALTTWLPAIKQHPVHILCALPLLHPLLTLSVLVLTGWNQTQWSRITSLSPQTAVVFRRQPVENIVI